MGELRLHLVCHGRLLVEPGRPASTWGLDPAGFDDVWALRERMPWGATWFCAPEPAAVETAQLLTDGEVGVLEGIAELRRPVGGEDDDAALARAFAAPGEPAGPGWESLEACRQRLRTALQPLERALDGEVVLIGHPVAWSVLEADLAGRTPRHDDLLGWTVPDLRTVTLAASS